MQIILIFLLILHLTQWSGVAPYKHVQVRIGTLAILVVRTTAFV